MADALFEVWMSLFRICWEAGLVPLLWKESLVVPVPKKTDKGICEPNNFRGVS